VVQDPNKTMEKNRALTMDRTDKKHIIKTVSRCITFSRNINHTIKHLFSYKKFLIAG